MKKATKYLDISVFVLGWIAIVISVISGMWLAAIFYLILVITIEKTFLSGGTMIPKSGQKGWMKIRDQIGYAVVTIGLRISSTWYRNMITGGIEYGLSAAIRDEREGREIPDSWRDDALLDKVAESSE